MVDDRAVHGAKDSVRHVGRAGDLKERSSAHAVTSRRGPHLRPLIIPSSELIGLRRCAPMGPLPHGPAAGAGEPLQSTCGTVSLVAVIWWIGYVGRGPS